MANPDRIPRLIGLYHGGTRQPLPQEANRYPVRGPSQNLSPEADTYVQYPRQYTAHGRMANRNRHMYRANRQRSVNDSLHVCTFNTQGL